MYRLSARSRPRVLRRGTLTPALPLLLVVLILLLALAVNQARLWTIRVELQDNADADALAALDTLVGDDLLKAFLYQDPAALPGLLGLSRAAALDFAQLNPVNANVLTLQDNPTNQPDGDIVFGTLDRHGSQTFTLATDVNNNQNAQLISINTIRINARLYQSRGNAPALYFPQFTGIPFADVQARSSAMLDRDVIGFQPVVPQALPLAPVALLADYSQSPAPTSWQSQVENRQAPDNLAFDAANQQFTAGSDGLPEFAAQLALTPNPATSANVRLLFIGTSDFHGLNAQLLNGVTPADLQAFGSPFVLDGSNQLTVPGTDQGPALGSQDEQDLQNNLDQLRQSAAVRIWPLYRSSGGGSVVLCGFVAGRVATVTPPAGPNDALQFTVQPTMIITHAAVTDATHRGINGVPLVNPYICKTWLVE